MTLDLGDCISACVFGQKFFVKRQNQSTSVKASSLGLCKSLQTIEQLLQLFGLLQIPLLEFVSHGLGEMAKQFKNLNM